MMRSRTAALVCALVPTWATLAPAQPRQPAFRARTVVTALEVHVADAAGRPVTDLTRDDFEVTEDGVAQVLIGAESLGRTPEVAASPAVTPAPLDAAAGQPRGLVRATNRRDSDTRAWALVVDDLRTPGFLRDRMKACLLALVAGLPGDDFVALVPTSGDRRAAREFTRDRAAIGEAIQALRFPREFDGVRSVASTGTLEGAAGLLGSSAVAPDRLDLISADNRLISTLGNAAMMLGRAGAPRRTVVLLGQGMAVALSDDYRRLLVAQGGGTALRRYDEWREVLERVQRSGVTLHVIDPTSFDEGLARRVATADRLAGPSARMRGYVSADDPQAAVRVIADASGGLFVAAPDPARGGGASHRRHDRRLCPALHAGARRARRPTTRRARAGTAFRRHRPCPHRVRAGQRSRIRGDPR